MDIDKLRNTSAGRKRIIELRKERGSSTAKTIGQRRTTIIINMAISICSGAIFAVGIYYVIMYLNMRKDFMSPAHYTFLIGAFLTVSVGWFIYLVLTIRKQYKQLRPVDRPVDGLD